MICKKIAARRVADIFLLFLAVVSPLLLTAPSARAQQDGVSKRKILERVAPAYPPLARSMALEGVVRVEAVVQPDGTVRSVDIKGGHPVLAQAAVNAVRRFKWEAAPRESRETVELKFSPE